MYCVPCAASPPLLPFPPPQIKGFYLPFMQHTHYATVVFKDREQGEFVYEFVGEPGLPPPCIEQKVRTSRSAHAIVTARQHVAPNQPMLRI